MNRLTNEARDVLQEVEEVARRYSEILPRWEELLKEAHAVGEDIQDRVEKVTAGSEPTGDAFG
jgi:hypothetical protein